VCIALETEKEETINLLWATFFTKLNIIDADAFFANMRIAFLAMGHGIRAELVSAFRASGAMCQGGVRTFRVGASAHATGIARIVASDAYDLVAELAFQIIGAGVAHWNSALDAMVGAIRAFLAHHDVLFFLAEASRHLAAFPVDATFALAALDGRILDTDFVVAHSTRESRRRRRDEVHGFDGDAEYGGHHS
jgi:hypothetical protein